jgi:hypothetical protein
VLAGTGLIPGRLKVQLAISHDSMILTLTTADASDLNVIMFPSVCVAKTNIVVDSRAVLLIELCEPRINKGKDCLNKRSTRVCILRYCAFVSTNDMAEMVAAIYIDPCFSIGSRINDSPVWLLLDNAKYTRVLCKNKINKRRRSEGRSKRMGKIGRCRFGYQRSSRFIWPRSSCSCSNRQRSRK